jgi:phosphate transport system substrate-binding protein
MAQKSGPPPIVYILVFLLLAGGGYLFFFRNQPQQSQIPQPGTALPNAPIPPASITTGGSFSFPASVPAGTTVRIDGSTSMVTINQNLKTGFQGQFPGTNVITNASSSDKGIQALIRGNIDVAAISRPLTPQEQAQGLVAVPVALDAIALVVGVNNPFQGSLTSGQVEDIFEGDITNWSNLGGGAGTIRVINRPAGSGTQQFFQELVLGGGNFGTAPNITTWPRDETTALFRELKTDGISYATFAQVVANKGTVRPLAVNGVLPDSLTYPYKRQLFYIYKYPPSPGVQAFIGYATSSQGQSAITQGGR